MKKILIGLLMLCLFSSAWAVSGAIVNESLATKNLTYVTSVNAYKDASPNADLGLLLCDVSYKWAGAVYAVNVSGTWSYATVNQRAGSTTYSLVNTSTLSGSCYYTNIASFIFSTSHITSTPEAFVAAFPARINILYSSNEDGSSPSFAFLNYSNGSMLGSYSITSPFDQDTRNVSVTVNSITFNTDNGDVTKAPSDPTWGITTDRRFVLGLCSNDNGTTCSDGKVLSSSSMPVSLSTGLSAGQVNDQNSYTRYAVANGLGYPLYIGANLQASVTSNSSSPYDGDTVSFTVVVPNVGNVNVTTDFNVTLYDNGSPFNTTRVTQTIIPGGNATLSVNYNTYSKSGSHTIIASADSGSEIVETSETDNNGTTALNVSTTYNAVVYINGAISSTFAEAGKPYNVTIKVQNSSGSAIPNATVRIIEANGLSMFAQMQLWNDTYFSSGKTGLKSYSIAEVVTNSTGNVSFTLVPTGNKMYVSPYNETYTPSLYVGDYSMYLEIYLNGQKQKINGTGQDTQSLSLTNLTTQTTGSTTVGNQGFVQTVTNFVADVFQAVRGWLT